MVLAMIVGLLGGILAAFFVEYMDDTIKTPRTSRISRPPLSGHRPLHERRGRAHLHVCRAPGGVAEAYRTIRTSIMLSSGDDNPLQVILVTSTVPNEGKTTTAANLAVAMAQMESGCCS